MQVSFQELYNLSNVLFVVLACLICEQGILSSLDRRTPNLHVGYSKLEHVLPGQLTFDTQKPFSPPLPVPRHLSIQASAIVMKMLQSTWNDRSLRPRQASKDFPLPSCVTKCHKSGKSRAALSKLPSRFHNDDSVVLWYSEIRRQHLKTLRDSYFRSKRHSIGGSSPLEIGFTDAIGLSP